MNIFVGNLLFEATEEDVRKAFEEFGSVESVAIVMDKKGVNSRGFGFVEMLNDQEAQQAIKALNGKEFMGRVLNIDVSHPKSAIDKEKIKKKQLKPKIIIEVKKNPLFPRPGGYKGGRRTRRFIEKRAAAGINEPIVLRRRQPENPLCWRKKKEQPKPWQKSKGESKPKLRFKKKK